MKTRIVFALALLLSVLATGCTDTLKEVVEDTAPEWITMEGWAIDSNSSLPTYLHDTITRTITRSAVMADLLPNTQDVHYVFFNGGDSIQYEAKTRPFWSARTFSLTLAGEQAETIAYDLYVRNWIIFVGDFPKDYKVGTYTFNKIAYSDQVPD
jgi:hypothetical protein